MRKLLFFLSFFYFLSISVFAQKIMPTYVQNGNAANYINRKVYYDGVVYVKMKPNFQKSGAVSKKVSFKKETPSLLKYQEALGLQKIEKPFYFSKKADLRTSYRLYFDKRKSMKSVINALKNDPSVEYVERVPIMYIPEKFNRPTIAAAKKSNTKKSSSTVNDPYYGNTLPISLQSGNSLVFGTKWFLDLIRAPQAWNLFTPQNNNPIKVAIVDGAVYKDHEDLNIVQSYDAESKTNNSNPPNSGDAYEWSHGTHCAGLVSAVTNNSVGIPSIGQNLQLIGVKTGQDSDGSLAYFMEGLLYAIEKTDAKIISLSVGSYGYSLTEQNIINEAYAKDIIVLAAASNDDISNKSYPAAYEHVMAVGSVSSNDKKSNFSNYGDWVDIMSPGGNTADSMYMLLSTTFVDASDDGPGIAANSSPVGSNNVNGKYHMMAGTSMATPVAAGLVGLMRAADTTLNADQIEAILKRTCDNIDDKNMNYIGLLGSGRINAEKAIQTILNNNELIAVLAYSSLEIAPGDQVYFSDKSIGNPTSWQWTFTGPESLTSSEQNPLISFNLVGDYTVQLVVSNGITSDTTLLSQKVKVGTSTSIEIEATAFDSTSRGITNISVADKNIVWALAYDGLDSTNYIQDFTVTTDGGKTWKAKQFGLEPNLAAGMIFALNADTAWVPMFNNGNSGSGKQGIYITSDGGKSWTRQSSASYSSDSSFPNVVYFWNANEGVCMGDPESGYFEIYRTSDGGKNWSRVVSSSNVLNAKTSDEYGTVGYFSVSDDKTFFFNTNKGRVFKTTDKGKTWSVYDTPVSGSNKIAFSSADYGIMVDVDTEKAYYTDNGGTNWQNLDYTGEFFVNNFVYVPGSRNMFASTGSDYTADKLGLTFSRDGGKTWIDVPELSEQQCLDLAFYDITTGWIGQFSVDATTGGMLKYNGPNTFAEFTTDREAACSDQSNSITFSDKTSTGAANPTYLWDFGKDASPSTALGIGPHSVKYSSEGVREVKLTVNDVYTVKHTINVTVPAYLGNVIVDTTRVCQWASAHLKVDSVYGDIRWQMAVLDPNNFVNSESVSSTAKDFYSNPIQDTSYYRVKVTTEGCDSLFSQAKRIDISRITANYNWERDSFTVNFMDASENAIDYLWDFGDGTNSTEASPSHTYTEEKEFYAKQVVTNAEACMDSISEKVLVKVTGIENQLTKGKLKVYPIPNHGLFTIEFSGVEMTHFDLRIISLSGKTVLDKKVYGNKIQINLRNFNKGIYLMNLNSKYGKVVKKVIVQ